MRTRLYPAGLTALLLLSLIAIHSATAKTENGNDLCLSLSEAIEAENADEISYLKDESHGVAYFFRYLEIIEMQSGRENGRPYVDILSREPSSYLHLKFRVTKKESLTRLMQEPRSKIGSAVAVLGRAATIDEQAKLLTIDPVIIKHKDRLTPKVGKELLGEVDPSARYYSYTAVAGKKVEVSFADRDLIENNRNRIPEFEASQAEKEAWADFLLGELAKRRNARESGLMEARKAAGIMKESTNAPVLKNDW